MGQTAEIHPSPYLPCTAKGMVSLEKPRQPSSPLLLLTQWPQGSETPISAETIPTERKQNNPDWAFPHPETTCTIQLLIW